MTMRMSKDAYQNLIGENISWLLRQERTLEREHTIQILRQSPAREYDDADQMQRLGRINAQLLEALEGLLTSQTTGNMLKASNAIAKAKGETK